MEEGSDAVSLAESRKDSLTIVAEGRVADVVSQRNGLQEILVEAEVTADGAGDFGEKLNVKGPVAYMVVLDEIKDLGFVNIAGIGLGMEDAVGVYRKILTMAFLNALFKTAPNGLGTPGGIRCEVCFFLPIEFLAQIPQINHNE